MKTKHEIRREVWNRLRERGVGRFPFPLEGRIPNFAGAEAAVDRLARERFYRQSAHLKCNPDSPQRPLRQRALMDGKVVFMAVPRLRQEKCFIRLDPHELRPAHYARAASISGASRFGTPVHPREMSEIDLVVAGTVAANASGARIGKGGGYSDLEFAIGCELGLITDTTVVVTTVHDEQVIEDQWEVRPWDIPVDWIMTPTRTIECKGRHPRPSGILWDELDRGMREDIPLLETLSR